MIYFGECWELGGTSPPFFFPLSFFLFQIRWALRMGGRALFPAPCHPLSKVELPRPLPASLSSSCLTASSYLCAQVALAVGGKSTRDRVTTTNEKMTGRRKANLKVSWNSHAPNAQRKTSLIHLYTHTSFYLQLFPNAIEVTRQATRSPLHSTPTFQPLPISSSTTTSSSSSSS